MSKSSAEILQKKLRLSIAHRLRKKYTHSGSKDDGKQLSIAARTCNSLRIVHSSRCLLEADQWNIGRTTHGARQYSERSGDTLEPCNEPCHLSNPEKERFHWKRIAPLQAVRSESIPKFRALLSSTHESVFRANHAVHENFWGIPDLLFQDSVQNALSKRNITSRPPGPIRTTERSPLSARQSTEPITWPLHFLWKVRQHLLRCNAKIVLPNIYLCHFA
jgi:hypothetical protein